MLGVAISKRLANATGAFDLRLAFDAPTPGVVALFGRSGCGKTTAVNIMAGLLRPDEGHVRVDDAVLVDTHARTDIPAERRRVGYVFQDARLFPHLSVLGNLRYGLKRAPSVSQPIPLEHVVSLLGLETLLRRRPHQLSGGERQRVALGRALLSQPRLLLLDEPLASLDAARREEVLPYLVTLRDKLSIPMVYVSHQFDEVIRLATHVVLLDAGQVTAQGSLNEVSLRPELRQIVGTEAVGAVLDGVVTGVDASRNVAELGIGGGTLHVTLREGRVGQRVRVQLLARDVILGIDPPYGLSVRNALQGVVSEISLDEDDARLIRVDIGGGEVLARVTHGAVNALRLEPGRNVWVLIKAVSMRGYAMQAS